LTQPTDEKYERLLVAVTTLDTKFDDLLGRMNGYIPKHCIEHGNAISQVQKDVQEMKDGNTWLKRAVFAALIGAVASPAILFLAQHIHF
jgi:hypothetical protein